MKKTIVIGISLLFFVGIASQVTARKLHCWDLNENFNCDIETEDMNNDGKCNPRDCEIEEPCYAVPQTGQTICSNDFVIIDCTNTGQDGEYQMGVVCPDPRFTDNGDGTVTDNCTGLIWLQNANCFGKKLWSAALTDSNNLADESCGLTDGSVVGDWRLPNVRELASLIDYGNWAPALPTDNHFTGVESFAYWTSTTAQQEKGYAWYVSFTGGNVSLTAKEEYLQHYNYVWPVRGGN